MLRIVLQFNKTFFFIFRNLKALDIYAIFIFCCLRFELDQSMQQKPMIPLPVPQATWRVVEGSLNITMVVDVMQDYVKSLDRMKMFDTSCPTLLP